MSPPAAPQEVRPEPSAAVLRVSNPAAQRPARGDCALSAERVFNGTQRWKETLEDPVVPFRPRLRRRPRAATLGSGGFGTRMWWLRSSGL